MSNIEKIKAEIERLYDGEAPKHDQQCDFNDGYFTGIDAVSKFIDSLPEEKPSDDLEEAGARYERENRESILSSVDIVDAFIAGAEWQKKHLTVEDIKTILDISFWNDDPEKILDEYNRLHQTKA